ncbi:MAG: response regulator transcription factor [bacterium]
MSIRVLIVDDHQLVSDGLRTLLEAEPEIQVVAEAENGREAVKLVQKFLPNVVIMDITMPGLNGIDATRQIVSEYPHIKILALSMHSEKKFIRDILQSGAAGYILKDCAFEELIQAVHAVLSNQLYMSPKIRNIMNNSYGGLCNNTIVCSGVLTKREREVLQLFAEGKTTNQIALLLVLSIKTIETHRSNIMEKLNIHSIAEITKYAIREGLTSVEC